MQEAPTEIDEKLTILMQVLKGHFYGDENPWDVKARIINLFSEDRVRSSDLFLKYLCEEHFSDSEVPKTQEAFFKLCRQKLSSPISSWLGLIETSTAWLHGYTYVSLKDINSFLVTVRVIGQPKKIVLTRPLKYNYSTREALKKFIWITSEESLQIVEGTDLVKKLGLPHYKQGEVMYRIKMNVSGKRLFLPTAYDAELYEAWSYPTRHESEGMGRTRDLETGDLVFPELVTDTKDHINENLVAERVGSEDDSMVGNYNSNFLIGREIKRTEDCFG